MIHDSFFNYRSQILLNAFNKFNGNPGQVRAIQKLEEDINPYILSEFANRFNSNIDNLERSFDSDFYASV